MTITEIETKIAELDSWLVQNPTDPYHAHVQKDKRAYEHRLQLLKGPGYHNIEVTDPEVLSETLKECFYCHTSSPTRTCEACANALSKL